jgi:hypothetical protein
MPGTGQGTAGAGLKAQYRFTRWFRMWAGVGGQRDVDPSGQATLTVAFSLGAGYRF